LSIITGGLGRLKYILIIFTIKVARRAANIPDQIKSGLFLMKRSMIAQAVRVSPRKVRFAQIKGLECAVNELISIKRALLFPNSSKKTKQRRNIINNI
jgi:hypothetical protein